MSFSHCNTPFADVSRPCLSVRQLRGHSLPILVKADGGQLYVLKKIGNPQGTRSLWNEWFVHNLLKRFEIAVPGIDFLHLTEEWNRTSKAPSAGSACETHLGSKLPENPEIRALYDFLPTKFLKTLENRDHFVRMLVLDYWLGQSDHRQAVFVRTAGDSEARFRAWFIDHGRCFSGSEWKLNRSGNLLYYNRNVYPRERMRDLVNEIVSEIDCFTLEDLHKAALGAPPAWFNTSDEREIARLFESLIQRKRTLRSELEPVLQQVLVQTPSN